MCRFLHNGSEGPPPNVINKNGPAGNLTFRPGQPPPDLTRSDRVKPTQPQHPKHDPRTCQLCASLRHPGMAKQGRALQDHLAAHPFPKQAVSA